MSVYLKPEQHPREWAAPLLGLLSYVAAYALSSDGWKRCRLAVLSILAGSTVHAVLNARMIVLDYGLVPSTRIFSDVWTGGYWTATGQATLWVPLVGATPYMLFAGRKRAMVLLGWASLGVSLWASAALQSRTLIGLTGLSLLLGATVALTRRGGPARGAVAAMSSMATLALVAYFVVPSTFIDGLPLVRRLGSGQPGLGDDPRLERWSFYLRHMWDSPNGGGKLERTVGYAHNMWLDSFDAYGAVAFALLFLFTVTFIVGLVRTPRSLRPSTGGLLLLGVGVTWMIQAATEPLIELSPYFFAAGCGFAGATAGVLRSLSCEGLDREEAIANMDPRLELPRLAAPPVLRARAPKGGL